MNFANDLEDMRFEAVFGTNPGYHHDNEEFGILEQVTSKWQGIQDVSVKSGGPCASGVCTFAKVAYAQKFGCPEGGEDVVVVTGEWNGQHDPLEVWAEAVRRSVAQVKEHFGIHRVWLSFVGSKLEVFE